MLFAYDDRPGNCPVIAAGPDNIFVLTVDSLLPFCYLYGIYLLLSTKAIDSSQRMTSQNIER